MGVAYGDLCEDSDVHRGRVKWSGVINQKTLVRVMISALRHKPLEEVMHGVDWTALGGEK